MAYTLESLAEEQDSLALGRFDYDTAWVLGSLIHARAAAVHASVGISVTHGTALVFLALLPGATPDNLDWMARKRAVALRFHRSSLAMRLQAEAGGYDFNALFRLPPTDFVASGGGLPLMLRGGTLIGSVAVSGLPDMEDHRMVVAALRDLGGIA